jgi:hypothetical protein
MDHQSAWRGDSDLRYLAWEPLGFLAPEQQAVVLVRWQPALALQLCCRLALERRPIVGWRLVLLVES